MQKIEFEVVFPFDPRTDTDIFEDYNPSTLLFTQIHGYNNSSSLNNLEKMIVKFGKNKKYKITVETIEE